VRGRHHIRHLWLADLAADLLAVAASYYATLLFRFHSISGVAFFNFLNRTLDLRETGELHPAYEEFYLTSAPRIITILAATICFLYAMHDLYAGRRFISRRQTAWKVLVSNVWALLVFYAYFYLTRNEFHPRSVFATMLALNVPVTVLARRAAGFLLGIGRRRGFDVWRALLLGSGSGADLLDEGISAARPNGLRIEMRLPVEGGRISEELLSLAREKIRSAGIDVLIVAEQGLQVGEIMRLLELADEERVEVKVLTDKLDVLVSRALLSVDVVAGMPLFHFGLRRNGSVSMVVQRVVSVASAALLLALLSPVMLAAILLIRGSGPGPVFFVQERIGINRKPFRMFKFRTMRHGAESAQAEIEALNESGAGLFKVKSDPRVTRVGRFLRMFSIDELPQLVNVIRGEMRIVGPRPLPRRDFRNYYEEWHYSRHDDLPGMTCLWQVSGRSCLDFHSMCILDIYYLRNRSWVLDLQIILRTAWAVLFARGAY